LNNNDPDSRPGFAGLPANLGFWRKLERAFQHVLRETLLPTPPGVNLRRDVTSWLVAPITVAVTPRCFKGETKYTGGTHIFKFNF
jgi:hypothetical protein